MKKSMKWATIALAAIIFVCNSSFAKTGVKEKAVEKATSQVANASPDDWKVLAVQADYLIQKDAGMSSAKAWLDQSLSIKEDTYNLEIMGDYYAHSNLPEKAITFYLRSMDQRKSQTGDPNIFTQDLQNKIVAAKTQG